MDIWDALISSWPAVESFLKIAPALVLLPLTFFLGWKKIGNKVQASFSWNLGRITANHLSNLVITNLKDKPITIHEIHVMIDRHIVVPIQKLSPPMVLKGLESSVIQPTPVSHYYLGDQEYEFDQRHDQLIELFITTQAGLIQCEIVNTPSIESLMRFMDYALVQTHTRKYNGVIYNDDALYALVYKYGGQTRTAIIETGGFISTDWPWLPNMLPPSALATEQTVKEALMTSDIRYLIKAEELLVHKLD